ncbi:calcium-binding protein [Aquitalea sp. USM4]|uniref:calcium-binding protein n=1 Tax=Aquitalea sp. USM4 TaxID=1590041 RepID=UPI00103C264A|nr:calcium-binding protein [Aquitalea sp. USM4]QBJ77863.1 hypothetical protein DKK66_06970 [Aquitalea sp. USM4]
MAKIIVHIASIGNPLQTGGSSKTGHMWYTLIDSNGNAKSWGFEPADSGKPVDYGKVENDDDSNYISPGYSKEIDITDDQYHEINDFAQYAQDQTENQTGYWWGDDIANIFSGGGGYNGLANNCISFTWMSLKAGNINPKSMGWHFTVLPTQNIPFISALVNSNFSKTLFSSGADPLAIDLTGSGIHTIGADQSGVMFDVNGSGNTVATGWIAQGTGWLVYDPTGASTLTSETQLLGTQTVLSNGQYAVDGFQALSALDSNADGHINTSDPEFSNLRIWVGAPSEGSANPNLTAGQMMTLQQLGIVDISLNKTNSWINTGGIGNEVNVESAYATVTWQDGHQTTIGDVNLVSNPFYQNLVAPSSDILTAIQKDLVLTNAGQPITLSNLPEIKGSGAVYDSQTAAASSGGFANVLQQYSSLSTRDEQIAMLPGLLQAWSSTSSFKGLMQRNTWGIMDPCYEYAFEGIQKYNNPNATHAPGDSSDWTADYRNMVNMVNVLEIFNGQTMYQPKKSELLWGYNQANLVNMGQSSSSEKDYLLTPWFTVPVTQTQINNLQQSYLALEQSVYQGLLLQTRLKPYLDAVTLNVSGNLIGMGTSALDSLLNTSFTANPVSTTEDLLELVAYGSDVLNIVGYNPVGKLTQWVSQLSASGQWNTVLSDFNGILSSMPAGSSDNSVPQILELLNSNTQGNLVIATGSGTFNGTNGNDTMVAGTGGGQLLQDGGAHITFDYAKGDGNDTINLTSAQSTSVLQLTGYNDSDLLLHRSGNSLLLSFAGGDSVLLNNYFINPQNYTTVQFDDGSQKSVTELIAEGRVMHGNGSGTYSLDFGNSTIVAGIGGGEVFTGNSYNDTFIYSRGDGADSISDSVNGFGSGSRTSQNVLKLTDYNRSDLWWSQSGYSLVLHFGPPGASDDSILLQDYYLRMQVWNGDTNLSAIQFADGTQMSWSDLMNSPNVIPGQVITASGPGTFSLPSSYDTLVAGIGNELLQGIGNHDTYSYSKGDGADTINDTINGFGTAKAISPNTLILNGYNQSDLQLHSVGDSLVLGFSNGDSITLPDYFSRFNKSGDTGITDIKFSDGSSVNIVDLIKKSTIAVDASNGIYNGHGSNQLFVGNGGNDVMNGGTGNDTFLSGTGNDLITGSSAGANFYHIQSGAGSDTIQNSTGGSVNNSSVVFEAAQSNELWFQKSGNDLLVNVIGTSTQVDISGWYSGSDHQVDTISAADGKTLSNSQVNALVSAMAAFSPPALGTTSLTQSYQDTLQPIISSSWH